MWKKILGVVLIIVGFLALITPLTPGAWLMFIGFEFLGFRLLAWSRVKEWLVKKGRQTESEDTKKDS